MSLRVTWADDAKPLLRLNAASCHRPPQSTSTNEPTTLSLFLLSPTLLHLNFARIRLETATRRTKAEDKEILTSCKWIKQRSSRRCRANSLKMADSFSLDAQNVCVGDVRFATCFMGIHNFVTGRTEANMLNHSRQA